MKTMDLEAILKAAGGDGASLPAAGRIKTRIFHQAKFAMEPDVDGVEHDLEVVVCTPSRWEALSRRQHWRSDEFTTMACGPIVVAIRISR